MWNMRIKRIEKIGICATMSLGVFVAAFSTWRTVYMMDPSVDDYNHGWFERQGLSMVWFIGEVAGTIIVQALPIIRHLGRDKTQTKTLVSMELNEVPHATTKIWSDADSNPEKEKFDSQAWKDLESGVTGLKFEPGKGLHSQWKLPRPPRASWSTYRQSRISLSTW